MNLYIPMLMAPHLLPYIAGLFYPSSQGQGGCDASRQANNKSTDLNCTARERFRVLTGHNQSYGATDTHTNITRPDSIVNRVAKALAALGHPYNGWLREDMTPDWSRVVIAGHSNGADHAGRGRGEGLRGGDDMCATECFEE